MLPFPKWNLHGMCFYFLWVILKGNRDTRFRKWQTLEKQENIKYFWTDWFPHKKAVPITKQTVVRPVPSNRQAQMSVLLQWHGIMVFLPFGRARCRSRFLWGTPQWEQGFREAGLPPPLLYSCESCTCLRTFGVDTVLVCWVWGLVSLLVCVHLPNVRNEVIWSGFLLFTFSISTILFHT